MSIRSYATVLAVTLCATGCAGHIARPPQVPPASSLESAPDEFVQLGPARIRYREAGTGEPLVLIHGYTGRLDFMASLGDSVVQDHRVIALDLRGFGESTKFSREADYGRLMADDVVRLLDRLHVQRAHLVGHSMGALIAGNIVARYPSRVATATLIAGPFWPDSAAAVSDVARWGRELDAGRGLTSFFLWILPGMDTATAQNSSRAAMAANDFNSMRAVLPSLGALTVGLERAPRVPVLIAAAGGDPLEQYSQALARRWPTAQLLELPSASHVSILGEPELLAAIRRITRR